MTFPSSPAARDAVVAELRPRRDVRDPWAEPEILVEDEETLSGTISTLTVFLVGRECPWRCVMCDLWKQTTDTNTPAGAIPAQIRSACERIDAQSRAAPHIKLYNAGSFFDPRAVPEADYRDIAVLLRRFRRVILECHPALVGHRVDRFTRRLREECPGIALEIAMGLETAHPDALESLNKRMDVEHFVAAADYLRARHIDLRVFLLIWPPFIPAAEQDRWLLTSLDVALDCGASVISLIPTRGGNGAMEALSAEGLFEAPSAAVVEHCARLARRHVGTRAVVLLDPWSAS